MSESIPAKRVKRVGHAHAATAVGMEPAEPFGDPQPANLVTIASLDNVFWYLLSFLDSSLNHSLVPLALTCRALCHAVTSAATRAFLDLSLVSAATPDGVSAGRVPRETSCLEQPCELYRRRPTSLDPEARRRGASVRASLFLLPSFERLRHLCVSTCAPEATRSSNPLDWPLGPQPWATREPLERLAPPFRLSDRRLAQAFSRLKTLESVEVYHNPDLNGDFLLGLFWNPPRGPHRLASSGGSNRARESSSSSGAILPDESHVGAASRRELPPPGWLVPDSEMLRPNRTITRLSLAGCTRLSNVSLHLALQLLPLLEELDLSDCKQLHCWAVAPLAATTRLRVLRLSRLKHVNYLDLSRLVALQELDLSDTAIDDRTLYTVANAMHSNNARALHVATSASGKRLRSATEGGAADEGSTLSVLGLCGCKAVTDAGLRALLEASGRSLAVLDLSCCDQLTDAVCFAMAAPVWPRTFFVKPRAWTSPAGGEPAQEPPLPVDGGSSAAGSAHSAPAAYPAETLGAAVLCSRLRVLRMDECEQITDAGFAELRHLPCLSSLSCSWCWRLTDEGIAPVAAALVCRSLRPASAPSVCKLTLLGLNVTDGLLRLIAESDERARLDCSSDVGPCGCSPDNPNLRPGSNASSRNGVGGVGLQALHLGWCPQLTDESLLALSRMHRSLRWLRLDLKMNAPSVSRSALAVLLVSLDNLQGLHLADAPQIDIAMIRWLTENMQRNCRCTPRASQPQPGHQHGQDGALSPEIAHTLSSASTTNSAPTCCRCCQGGGIAHSLESLAFVSCALLQRDECAPLLDLWPRLKSWAIHDSSAMSCTADSDGDSSPGDQSPVESPHSERSAEEGSCD